MIRMPEQPSGSSSQPPLDIGVVVSVSGTTARVQPEHHSACSTCGSSSLCFPQDQATPLLDAVNQVGAKAGDRVILTRGEAPRIGAAMIVFGLPVAMTIGGAVIGLDAAGQDA